MSRLLRKLAFCAKSEPKQKQTSDVECAVCQDEPNVPCTVPCGNHHVFCLACLQGLVTHNHYTTHFPCPLCRTRVRIPLGGVAAFKQGKGKGSKLLSRLPIIRPRCRRSSLDSSSSGWPDDLTFSDIMVVMHTQTDSDDSDGLSSLGVPSEGGESIRELNLEGWYAPDNAYVEGQAAILEEIRQNRELSDHVSQDEMGINSLQRNVSGESENASEGRDRQGRPVLTVTEDDSSSSDVDDIATSGEGLDMAVVLQLIADLERNESQEDTHHATAEGTETTECQAQVSARSALSDCSETTEENDKTNEDVEHSDSRGQDADWKSRTIVETVIPRPKLTTHCDTSWDERNFRLQHESTNDEVGCPGIFPLEAGADLTHFEEDLDSLSLHEQRKMLLLRKAKFDQYRGQMSSDHNKSSESEPSSADTQEDWNAQKLLLMNNASTGTATPSTDHVWENTASPAVSEESSTDSLTRDNTDSKRSTTAGETLRLPEAGIRMPEEWRLCKCQKLRMTHVRRTASLPDNDLSLDTDIIISEDPDEWIKRIHSLRQCRRGQGSKRPITCSQSHGGKPATSGSVRETETKTQIEDMPSKVEESGDKDSDGRGEDMQNVVDCLDGETKDAVLSCGKQSKQCDHHSRLEERQSLVRTVLLMMFKREGMVDMLKDKLCYWHTEIIVHQLVSIYCAQLVSACACVCVCLHVRVCVCIGRCTYLTYPCTLPSNSVNDLTFCKVSSNLNTSQKQVQWYLILPTILA